MKKIRLPPIGFLSYARQDDELSGQKLSKLRELIKAELQLQYGRETVKLFQDVSTIPHGAAWERETLKALDDSTFFVPIITPNFIQSEWCCREVKIFIERERRMFALHPDLPPESRIFPIDYRKIRDDRAYDPEALALLRTRQWCDFQELRDKDPYGETVSRAIYDFAESICELLLIEVEAPPTPEELARQKAEAEAARKQAEAAKRKAAAEARKEEKERLNREEAKRRQDAEARKLAEQDEARRAAEQAEAAAARARVQDDERRRHAAAAAQAEETQRRWREEAEAAEREQAQRRQRAQAERERVVAELASARLVREAGLARESNKEPESWMLRGIVWFFILTVVAVAAAIMIGSSPRSPAVPVIDTPEPEVNWMDHSNEAAGETRPVMDDAAANGTFDGTAGNIDSGLVGNEQ